MEKIFASGLIIKNVRHLKNITIPLSDEKLKHLIFTGKNGSGKTSVLEALSHYLDFWITSEKVAETLNDLRSWQDPTVDHPDFVDVNSWIEGCKKRLEELGNTNIGVEMQFNCLEDRLRECFQNGQFVLAYYKAERAFIYAK